MEQLLQQCNHDPKHPTEVEELLIKNNDIDLYNLNS